MVDVPVDAHYPTIQEVRALLVMTTKQALMHTTQPSCCVLFLMMFGVARGFADWCLGALLRIL
jgi:hypothetical protein